MEGMLPIQPLCVNWEADPRALSAVMLVEVCYSSLKHSVLWTSVERAEFGIPADDPANNIVCASAVQTRFIKT